ncbi:hypothetical protein MNBD_GAMMA23-684 [hydrothermal vent metagenome]|uniref:Uncharacterized protein n=1 Tax=hydrothermal vent metagenome TaxID=652676 RepID=A0A3B1A2A6_9ZZZZ
MNLVVKAHRPWVTRLIWVLGFIALLIAGWSAFDYGRYSAQFDSADARRSENSFAEIRDALSTEIETLREEKAILKRAAQIEKKAYNELYTTLKALQSEILELKEELAFYRGIVSPRDASRGLRLQKFTFEENGNSRSYRYKVVLSQVLKNDRVARGNVQLVFEGLQGGQAKELKLRDVTAKHIKELNYKFKYFQNIEGNIEIPVGFVAARIILRIFPRGRRQDMIEKTFDWPKTENSENVGKQEEAEADSTD